MRERRLRTALAVAAAAAATLALPSAASAAVTINANAAARTLDIAGDGAVDRIVLKVVGGVYVVTDGGTDRPTGLTAAADIAITIDGGDNLDSIQVQASLRGLARSLTIHGGAGDDFLFDDSVGTPRAQLFGDDGNDTIEGVEEDYDGFGGAGDDTLKLFAGGVGILFDGAATISGGEGIDTIEYFTQNDQTDVAIRPGAVAGHVAIHSTFPAPSGVVDYDVTGVEKAIVHGGGGADTFTGADGLAALLPGGLDLDGRAGNDKLTGGDTFDTIKGGAGEDTLSGGGGGDFLQGDDGNDTLLARDGTADVVRGGAGDDSAVVDAVDAVDGAEHVDVPPPPPVGDVKAFAATVATGTVKLVRSHRRLVARVPVSCPAAETGGCAVSLTFQTARAVRLGRLRGVLVLGAKSVALTGGQRGTATVVLIGGAERLASKGRLAARASVLTRDRSGNVATSSRAVKLVVPRARK